MIITDNAWKPYGACFNTDHDFFLLREPRKTTTAAICAGCTVKAECLDYALVSNQEFGMWGGTTPDERIELRKVHPEVVAKRKAYEARGGKPRGNPKHRATAKA